MTAAKYRELIAKAIAVAKLRPHDGDRLCMPAFISALQGTLVIAGDRELVNGLLCALNLTTGAA